MFGIQKGFAAIAARVVPITKSSQDWSEPWYGGPIVSWSSPTSELDAFSAMIYQVLTLEGIGFLFALSQYSP